MSRSDQRALRRVVAAALLCAALSAAGPGLAQQRLRLHALPLAGLGEELTCFALAPRNPQRVFVGTSDGTIYRSDDGGATWQRAIVTPRRTLFYGRERSPDPRLEYALGLPGKSPHLQSWLRQRGGHTAGMSLQQLLVLKGDKYSNLNWIEVDWHDENRVFVGTTDGLYRSIDGGRSFVRLWQGTSGMRERMVTTIGTDPAKRDRLILGTASGLFYSNNGGTSFDKEMDFYIRDSYIRALYFSSEQAGLVHMAMGGAAMASPNGGSNWITTHWSLWGPHSNVQWLSLGPDNVRLMATGDGVWASAQGGEMGTWQRRGPRFIDRLITTVLASKEKGRWFATDETALWETRDAGASWQPIFQLGGGEAARWIAAADGDPGQLWLVTNRQVYRATVPPRAQSSANPPRDLRLLDIPDLHDFWRIVQRKKQLYFGDAQRYRDRAPYAALLPLLSFSAYYTRSVDVLKLRAFPFLHYDFLYHNRRSDGSIEFEVWAYWELSRLIFDRRELPHFGRIERNLNALRREVTERVDRLYQEYRNTATTLALRPPTDLYVQEMMRIRLQEIAAFFDAISGGYWSKSTGGVR